jgi:hypothetical protein
MFYQFIASLRQKIKEEVVNQYELESQIYQSIQRRWKADAVLYAKY